MKMKHLISSHSHSLLLFLLWEYLNASYLLKRRSYPIPLQCFKRKVSTFLSVRHRELWHSFRNLMWMQSAVEWDSLLLLKMERFHLSSLFKTWNKTTFRIFFIWQNLTFQYCLHVLQFSDLKWLPHQTSLITWEIRKITFCLNNRYQTLQQVNYTSAACGLAHSLCSTLLRLIGRPFAFDMLLFALQERTQAQKVVSYTIA